MKRKLAKLTKFLTSIGGIVLYFSGGKDSRLLLETMLAESIPFWVLRFDDGWTRTQRKVVDDIAIKHSLRVYSYPPLTSDLVGDGNGNLSLVSDYAVGGFGEFLPVIRDFVDGDRCAVDLTFDTSGKPVAPIRFATHVLGSKKSDRHYTFGDDAPISGPAFKIGKQKFVAPLYDWTDSDAS